MSALSQELNRLNQMFLAGQFNRVVRLCNRQLLRGRKKRAFLELKADALHMMGKPKQARKIFKTLIRLKPQNPSYLFGIGNTSYTLGEYDTAREHFTQVLKLEPSMTIAKALLADTCVRMGRTLEGEAILDEAIENGLPSQSEAEAFALLLSVKSQLQLKRGNVERAKSLLTSAISYDKFNDTLLEELRLMNEPVKSDSRVIKIALSGKSLFSTSPAENGVSYYGEYIVVARDVKHAIEYIRQVELDVDQESIFPESIEILPNRFYAHFGVIHCVSSSLIEPTVATSETILH